MASPNVTVPDELLAQTQVTAASEGMTVDELTAEALQKHITQRTLARMKRAAESASLGMSEEQIDDIVARAIQESPQESGSSDHARYQHLWLSVQVRQDANGTAGDRCTRRYRHRRVPADY